MSSVPLVREDAPEPVVRHARQRRESELTKDRILDAAQAEFVAVGFAGASTNRILARCGGSKATLFKHFRTKEALFSAVVERSSNRMLAHPEFVPAPYEDPATFLRAFGRHALPYLLSEDRLAVTRILMNEHSRFPALADAVYSAGPNRMMSLLVEHFRIWIDRGIMAPCDIDATARHFFGLLSGPIVMPTLIAGRDPPDEATIAKMTDEAVRIFLHGVTRDPAKK